MCIFGLRTVKGQLLNFWVKHAPRENTRERKTQNIRNTYTQEIKQQKKQKPSTQKASVVKYGAQDGASMRQP